jgi:hypothetical protein
MPPRCVCLYYRPVREETYLAARVIDLRLAAKVGNSGTKTDMYPHSDPASEPDRPTSRIASMRGPLVSTLLIVCGVSLLAVDPVLAQTSGNAFCSSDMAETLKNIFTLIQFGGPLVGGVIALGATVAIPVVRRADIKKELKEARNQGLIWGVFVAPLGTGILSFLLTNVVAGGASCAF